MPMLGTYLKDVFICHAREDKASIVSPLAKCLKDQGVECWIDEAEISAGESIVEKVNEGLRSSNFVVVVISRAFMSKNWPKREFLSAINAEASSGRVVVIPIVACPQTEIDSIIQEFPLISDKLHVFWDGDAGRAAVEVLNTVNKARGIQPAPVTRMHTCGLCESPFQHGVRVCLGCRRNIVYGLVKGERLLIRQIAGAALCVIAVIFAVYALPYLEDIFGFQLSIGWEHIVWYLMAALLVIAGLSLFIESHIAKKKRHLVRTLP